MKKALAIYGDGFHAVLPLHASMGGALEKAGYDVDAVADLELPYDRFNDYDLIVISRYGRDDAHLLRTGEERLWLSDENAKKLEDYVLGGGNLFLHHDAFALYPGDHILCKLAKAVFITHPPIGLMTVSPVRPEHPLNEGIHAFDLAEFFEAYTTTHTHMPVHNPETLPPDRYPEAWEAISLQCRERANWACERCGRDFSNARGRLHAHHKDRQRWNNDPSNLEALCVECHREITRHLR